MRYKSHNWQSQNDDILSQNETKIQNYEISQLWQSKWHTKSKLWDKSNYD